MRPSAASWPLGETTRRKIEAVFRGLDCGFHRQDAEVLAHPVPRALVVRHDRESQSAQGCRVSA